MLCSKFIHTFVIFLSESLSILFSIILSCCNLYALGKLYHKKLLYRTHFSKKTIILHRLAFSKKSTLQTTLICSKKGIFFVIKTVYINSIFMNPNCKAIHAMDIIPLTCSTYLYFRIPLKITLHMNGIMKFIIIIAT